MCHIKHLCVNELQKYQVCHKHFHEEDYSNSLHHRFLLNTAIPRLYNTDDNIDIVDTVDNSQHNFLLQENENQQNEISQSVPIDPSHLQKRIEHHDEQLSVQQHLLETLNMQHIELQKEVLEIKQKTYEKNTLQQSHSEHKNNEEKESIIQDLENRLSRLETYFCIVTTPKRNRGLRRRPILQKITRLPFPVPV